MNRDSRFFGQVSLLVRMLPFVAQQKCFALKGGTAINLFVRNLPRLSVDIDLTYLPIKPREESLREIDAALGKIKTDIETAIPNIKIQATNPKNTDSKRLTVSLDNYQIKIELSPVLRGTVCPVEEKAVAENVEDLFGYAKIQMVSLNDLYAGKICAALDRQHPRDLYDIKLLLENEGINRDLFRTFLVYLISHGRPIAELLSPTLKNIRAVFDSEFNGMTEERVSLNELLEARKQLLVEIHSSLTDADRAFLLSVKKCEPDWSLLGLAGVRELPAIKWKLINLQRMDNAKRATALHRLKSVLTANVSRI